MNATMSESSRSMTLRAKKAEDLMTANPVSINQTLTVREALAFLIERSISGAPVIDAAGLPVGVLTQTDLLIHDREALVGRRHSRPEALPAAREEAGVQVRDVMTPGVFAVGRHTPSERVVEKLCDLKVHRLFVVDASGVLVGVITPMDLLRHLTPDDR
jgi:CBS-domain-containing membrane protein